MGQAQQFFKSLPAELGIDARAQGLGPGFGMAQDGRAQGRVAGIAAGHLRDSVSKLSTVSGQQTSVARITASRRFVSSDAVTRSEDLVLARAGSGGAHRPAPRRPRDSPPSADPAPHCGGG